MYYIYKVLAHGVASGKELALPLNKDNLLCIIFAYSPFRYSSLSETMSQVGHMHWILQRRTVTVMPSAKCNTQKYIKSCGQTLDSFDPFRRHKGYQ